MIVQERVIERDDDDKCDSPIFIVGAHRSGTSLVRRMFNSHPDIACPPETFFVEHYVTMLDDPETALGYSGFGHDAEAMRADLAAKASSLHEAFRRAQGKNIWADKTPQYTACLDGIDRLFAGRARFVLVLRQPCDVAHSIFMRGWSFNEIEDPLESALMYVRDAISNLLEFEAENPDRCCRLDYRLLCSDPASTLTSSMRQIGLSFDPEMLRFGDKNHNYGLEDPVIRGKVDVEASAGASRAWSPSQKALAIDILGPRAFDEDYWG